MGERPDCADQRAADMLFAEVVSGPSSEFQTEVASMPEKAAAPHIGLPPLPLRKLYEADTSFSDAIVHMDGHCRIEKIARARKAIASAPVVKRGRPRKRA